MSDEFVNLYPGYNVLDKWDTPSWNAQTRKVFYQRLNNVPERSFFSPQEYETLEAVCGRIIPQPDRAQRPVPIAPFIDQKCASNQTDGTRYEGLPTMREAWRLGLAAIEDEARLRFGRRFVDLAPEAQDEILGDIQKGQVISNQWQQVKPDRFFKSRLTRDIVSVYYVHPAAMNEIGYGGPASPRGYVRMGFDRRDPWESMEVPQASGRAAQIAAPGEVSPAEIPE